MNSLFSRKFFWTSCACLVAFFFAAFFGCRRPEPLASDEEDKLEILVAVDPIAYMVERVGGDIVSVVALTPQGRDPESYAPTPGDLKRVVASRGFFRVGLPIEKRFERNIKSIAPNARAYDLCDNLTLLANPHRHGDHDEEERDDHDDEDSLDAHVWTSPANARVMVANIAAALAELDSSNAQTYDANAKAFDAELAALQEEIRARLEPYEGRGFVVFHPAYGYFAREFRLEQRAVEFEGKAPRPK
ncbi:MAG: zinc ABC transporter substrate-binding protein, partial [Thermoguttaceae bacterium]|nr:zinc ABC transporter substrate-binding protein [Thermoguttaceae bacterium]